jgi:hypothetical protein
LDFFLDESVNDRSDDPANRPDEYGISPWPTADVIDFLENTLNISMNNRGAVVQSHHEVFYQWKKLIETHQLVSPFKVVHVDAHSDLGMGSTSWTYLLSDFLSMDINDRPEAQQGDDGINFGSFLAFAFGCRWISEADFIINHNWHDDIPRNLLSQESYELVRERAPMSVLPYGDYDLEIEIMRSEVGLYLRLEYPGDEKAMRRAKGTLQYHHPGECRYPVFQHQMGLCLPFPFTRLCPIQR